MKFLATLPLLLLIACVTPESPAQAVYQTQSVYAVALKAELVYSNYPRCINGKTWTIVDPCSEVKVIKKMQKADDAAWAAIQNAQTAVRTEGYGEGKVTTALASAKALTNAFKSITDIYNIK